MQGVFTVGVVAFLHAVHLEAERVAIQADGSAVGLSDVQRHELGTKYIPHGFLCIVVVARQRRSEGQD